MRKPMTLTPEKLAANRRNAQKSTGPRTAEGKVAAKLNAVKHGLLAKTVVVRGRQCQESAAEFKQLCRAFYADLAPAGALECLLVDQIIQASWRLRRARTAEAGEITVSVDDGYWQRHRPHPQDVLGFWNDWDDPVWAMENSATGSAMLANWLREVRARVETEGELTDAAINIPFGGKPNRLATELEQLRQACSPPPEAAEDAGGKAAAKARLLAGIDKKLRLLDGQKEDCQERERIIEDGRQAAAVLPSGTTLEKIRRYETALERQLYRAMNELERLQRRRQGECVPAPLTMSVSAQA